MDLPKDYIVFSDIPFFINGEKITLSAQQYFMAAYGGYVYKVYDNPRKAPDCQVQNQAKS